MMCCNESFLMPLKRRKSVPCPSDNQSQELVQSECDTDTDKCGVNRSRQSTCATEDDDPAPKSCFVDSVEWQSTKSTAGCLFQTLGQYYDQPWFPTVVNEWSMLYYRCNHEADYWQNRDEWLAGDEEIRLAVWSEIIRHRDQTAGRCDQNVPEVMETQSCPNQANDQLDLKHKEVEQCCEEDQPSADGAAEIALSDLDDDLDWVNMRRKMRGSFAALNVARCEVSAELLDHIMIELCKYWAKVPACDNVIDQKLEKNITREIQNFRFKIYGVAVEIEPDIQHPSSEAFQKPEPCSLPKPCNESEACQNPKLCRQPKPCQEPKACQEPEACQEPKPCQQPKVCRQPKACQVLEACQKPKPCQQPKVCQQPEACQPPETCQQPKACQQPVACQQPKSCIQIKPCQEQPKPCQEPVACQQQKPCQEPKPCRKPEPRRKPEGCEPEECCCPQLPKPNCVRRRSTKTKMAEARSRLNAAQVRDRDPAIAWKCQD